MPAIAEELKPALIACSRRREPGLTRGELAAAFQKSKKTIWRWEQRFDLPVDQKNGRVLRYSIESVVGLVGLGFPINREAVARLGLDFEAIRTLASTLKSQSPASSSAAASVSDEAVFIAKDENDRRLIGVLKDPQYGPILRKIVQGLLS